MKGGKQVSHWFCEFETHLLCIMGELIRFSGNVMAVICCVSVCLHVRYMRSRHENVRVVGFNTVMCSRHESVRVVGFNTVFVLS